MRKTGFFLAVMIVVGYCLAPVLWQAITSVKPDHELTTLPPILPRTPTLEHYRSVFKEKHFLKILVNSSVVAGCATLFSVAIGALAGFGLAKLRIRAKSWILGFILSVSMFPPIAIVSPLYIVVRALELRDTWLALVLTYTAFSLPLSTWILTNFFREIPQEIYLASRVDGCTQLQAFLRIMLPLAAPGLFTTAILVFIFSWNEFLVALTFTATEASRTIPVAVALFPSLHEFPWGEIAAASVVATLPLILLVIGFQRRIVEGLMKGAVKA